MANEKNLKPKIYTLEEAKKYGQLGGIASGKAKRDKKIISNAYIKWLAERGKNGLTGLETMQEALSIAMMKNPTPMMKELREAIEGQTITIEKESDPLDGCSLEELKAMINGVSTSAQTEAKESDSEEKPS